ncbi:MAG: tetratricopeptide repeat protein [bacterium]
MNVSRRAFVIILFMGLTVCPVCLPFALISHADELKFTGRNADTLKRAVAFEREGKTTDAVAEYRLYLKKNKDVVPVYFYLGNLYWDSGYKDKALETFKEAEQACPT